MAKKRNHQPAKPVPAGHTPPAKSAREKRAAAKEKEKAAAAARRLAAKRKKQRNTAIGVVLALLAVGLIAWWMVSASNAKKNSPNPTGATAEYGVLVGKADAATRVVIYEDFLCPGCAALEQQTTSALTQAATSGAISVEYRPFKLLSTDYSERAAQAFWAVLDQAGPEVAKKFHDELFADQPEEKSQHPGIKELAATAGAVGADETKIRKALDDKTFKGFVARSNDAASKAGVNSTPTVFINDVLQDTSTAEGFQSTIDKLNQLAGAGAPTP